MGCGHSSNTANQPNNNVPQQQGGQAQQVAQSQGGSASVQQRGGNAQVSASGKQVAAVVVPKNLSKGGYEVKFKY